MSSSLQPVKQLLTRPDGTRISVQTYPHATDSPWVILVHGLGSDAYTNWLQAGWVRALRLAGRRLISFDLRGHGGSESPHDPDRYRLALMVGDLQAVLPDEEPIDAIGYSLGARLLLEFAAHDPHPIRRLVVGGSAGQPQMQGIDLDKIDAAVGGGPVPAEPETARIARTIMALPGNDPLALAALARGLSSDPDTARRTPDPQIPTLLAVGTDDPLHDRAQLWASELPAAEFVSIPGRNHVSAVPSGVFRSAAVEFVNR